MFISFHHRLQRAVGSKDAMIKDFKAKIDSLESSIALAEREGVAPSSAVPQQGPSAVIGVGSPGAGAPVLDVSNMSAAELRTRYEHIVYYLCICKNPWIVKLFVTNFHYRVAFSTFVFLKMSPADYVLLNWNEPGTEPVCKV